MKALLEHPLIARVIHVVRDHRVVLSQPGSPTGTLVSQWAKIMVLPQFVIMPFTVFLVGRWEGVMIFVARFLAMHIVYELDRRIPYTRALGLCHLLTFGPLFYYFTRNWDEICEGWGNDRKVFIGQYAVIAICLFLDARDLILDFVFGRPYPCYIRDHYRLQSVKALTEIKHQQIKQPVTWFSTFFW